MGAGFYGMYNLSGMVAATMLGCCLLGAGSGVGKTMNIPLPPGVGHAVLQTFVSGPITAFDPFADTFDFRQPWANFKTYLTPVVDELITHFKTNLRN